MLELGSICVYAQLLDINCAKLRKRFPEVEVLKLVVSYMSMSYMMMYFESEMGHKSKNKKKHDFRGSRFDDATTQLPF